MSNKLPKGVYDPQGNYPKSRKGLAVLGSTVTTPISELEAIDVAQAVKKITMRVSEFTAVCPVTGQPDYYDIDIEFIPNGKGIESKSLKLWLWNFRNEGLFCEALAPLVLEKVVGAINPIAATVITSQTPRGGIAIETVAKYAQPFD